MGAIDWTYIQRNYKGLYVAVLEDEGKATVVATGKTFREALDNARRDGQHEAYISYVQEEIGLAIGGGYEIPLSHVHFGPGVEDYWRASEKANHSD